jgi:uncharacterized protein (DUF1499 family)
MSSHQHRSLISTDCIQSLRPLARFAVAVLIAGVITIAASLTAIASPVPPSQMATLPGLQGVFAGTPPQNLGLHDGQLTECPPSPNCVLSQATDAKHAIAPISYHTDRETARQTLLKVLNAMPGNKVITQTDDYIRFEATVRLIGFVDDGEFYLPADELVIHLRSASRLGESDLGVNRRRLEQIRLAMRDLGV